MQYSILPPPSVLLPALGCHPDTPPILVGGTDIARFGANVSMMYLRLRSRPRNWIVSFCRWSGTDTYYSAAVITSYLEEVERAGWILEWFCIDAIGLGAGTVDALWNSSRRMKDLIRPINVSIPSKAVSPRFRNVRSEIAWNTRQFFRTYSIAFLNQIWLDKPAVRRVFADAGFPLTDRTAGRLGIPDWLGSERLREQATTLLYKADEMSQSGIQVESKEQFKLRTEQSSPDEFDALALTLNDRWSGLEDRKADNRGDFGAQSVAALWQLQAQMRGSIIGR